MLSKRTLLKNKAKFVADRISGPLLCGSSGIVGGCAAGVIYPWQFVLPKDESTSHYKLEVVINLACILVIVNPIVLPLSFTLGPVAGCAVGFQFGYEQGLKDGLKKMPAEFFCLKNSETKKANARIYRNINKKHYQTIKVNDSDSEEESIAKTSQILASVVERDAAMQRRGKNTITFFSIIPEELNVYIAKTMRKKFSEENARKIAAANYIPIRYAKY